MNTRHAFLTFLFLFGAVPAIVLVFECENRHQINVSVPSLDDASHKPAWIKTADLDGDSAPEPIVSVFAGAGFAGTGNVNIYRQASSRCV